MLFELTNCPGFTKILLTWIYWTSISGLPCPRCHAGKIPWAPAKAKDDWRVVNVTLQPCRPSGKNTARYSLPSLVTGIEQVVSAKLLGVTVSHKLKFDEHVKNSLTICNQRSYLLTYLLTYHVNKAVTNFTKCWTSYIMVVTASICSNAVHILLSSPTNRLFSFCWLISGNRIFWLKYDIRTIALAIFWQHFNLFQSINQQFYYLII